MVATIPILAWGAVCSVWGVLLLSQAVAARRGLLLRPAPAGELPDPMPSVFVVVAARDEADTIARCANAILRQDYPASALRLVVVDDRSSDGTAAVVERLSSEDPRVRLVRVGQLPAGWMGKSHALWHGTRGADADWLSFTDADCRLEACAVRTAVLEARRRHAQLLSLWPRDAAVGFWEHLIIPLCGGIVALWY
jgi:cellulose synthase/poly-beta-1,6-N-acetylglucosamine synthase-like glycosyltransferase